MKCKSLIDFICLAVCHSLRNTAICSMFYWLAKYKKLTKRRDGGGFRERDIGDGDIVCVKGLFFVQV